jgi:hypothetical protein
MLLARSQCRLLSYSSLGYTGLYMADNTCFQYLNDCVAQEKNYFGHIDVRRR